MAILYVIARMLRYSILFGFIFALSVYAFKDWFKSLCGLIFLMSVMERADMPRGMLGIPGCNPYNILLFFVILGWLTSRNKEQLKWDMPKLISFLLSSYFLIIVSSLVRFLFVDKSLISIPDRSVLSSSYIIENYFINSLKYVIPGLLIYHGCRHQNRANWVIYTLMAVYLLLALQTISRMGFAYVLDSKALQQKAARVLGKTPGYFRVDLAALMATGAWLFFCTTLFFKKKKFKQLMCLACSGTCLLALMLTGGRTGYATWGFLGSFFAVSRWRSLLFVGPTFVALLLTFVPAARDRFFEGFDESTAQNTDYMDTEVDGGLYAITSGRAVVWPVAIDRIVESPIFGYGFNGWFTTDGHTEIYGIVGAFWGHPHNAYIEFTLDNGFMGMLPVLCFYSIVLFKALGLYRSKDPFRIVVGSTCISVVLAYLISAFGALSFYPKPSTVFMWATIGLTLRYAYHPHFNKQSIITLNQVS